MNEAVLRTNLGQMLGKKMKEKRDGKRVKKASLKNKFLMS